MKQSIQLKLGQHLTMTPQLQQAIRLLQLSAVELQTEIQEALDSNLMLEAGEENAQDNDTANEDAGKATQSAGGEGATAKEENTKQEADNDAEPESSIQEQIPDELSVDSSWDDVYDPPPTPTNMAQSEASDFEVQRGASETLRDHLLWQLNLATMSERDNIIATAIIDAVGNDGYLGTPLEEIHEGLSDHEDLQDEENLLELDEVEAVLLAVQNFDPPGIAARTPADCLHIQLRQLPEETLWRTEAITLVTRFLDLLATQQLPQLKRKMRLDEEDLQEVIALIRSLNPRPGREIDDGETQYVAPDVYVRKISEEWIVDLNNESTPKLRINTDYAGLIRRADNSKDNQYLKNHLQEARWFIKSLQSRNETLLKVARSIVQYQQDFLEYGEEAMKPLVLRDIAEDVDMHESTISRVTTQKYMHTPRGIFEFKYFFSSHVNTAAGGECSATAIRALIKKLIAAETPKKPLSDSKIADILSEQGINVARRTVAKYRESMGIPASNERKRLI